VPGLSLSTRAGFGWPTRSRALALTAFAAENRAGLRFVTAKTSMEENSVKGKSHRFTEDQHWTRKRGPRLPESQVWNQRISRAMDERDFFNETTELRTHMLTCPKCGQPAEYKVTWVVRRKRPQLPRGADERDRAKFAKAQSYMVRRDDKLACANMRCRKPFEITQLQSLAFLTD